jgi:putative nucleotidyltransferase with HDIG domain
VVALPSSMVSRIDSHLTPELVSKSREYDRIAAIYATIRERDIPTAEHSRRVAIYAHRLARALGFSREAARPYDRLGRIHDVGKAWITETILNKRGPLTPEEIAVVRAHASNGARIVAGYDLPDFYVQGVHSHHEAYNGSGYPDQISGDDIPLAARVIAIADAFDVITSDRPYKTAATLDVAMAELKSGAGKQFDPVFVQVFAEVALHYPQFIVPARLCVLPTNTARHKIASGF